MRWPVAALGIIASLLVIATPAAGASVVAGPLGSAHPDALPLASDAVPLPPTSSPRALPPSTPVSLTLTLANPHAGALDQFLAQVEDPLSPSYRHFLTYPEFVAEFAPSPSSVAQVETSLSAAGATDVTATPDHSSVSAVLSAGAVEQVLGIRLVVYGSAGRLPLYTATGTPSLPAALEGLVSGLGGLSDAASAELVASSASLAHAVRPASGPGDQFVSDNQTGDWFFGSDYTQAYGANRLLPGTSSVPGATYPTQVAIATILASSYNETYLDNLPPWDPAVVDAYFNGTFAPGWPIPTLTGVPVTVGGATPPLPGSLGSQTDDSLDETENSLDLEMAGSLAPGASLYNFYFAGSLLAGSSTVGDAADYLDADLASALAYDYAPAHLVTVSCSFGLSDLNDSAWNSELLTAAATGVTLVSASGDQGNAPDDLTGRDDGQWPVWPATAASNDSGSVSVGGVTLGLSGTPTSVWNGTSLNLSYDPNAGSISGMSTWYDTSGGPGNYAGSEGGISTVFPEPWWQFDSAAQPAIVNATVLQSAGSLGRAGPDLAMPGNATVVTDSANASGAIFFDVLEGTSVAAPVLAGLLADVVAVENNVAPGPWTSLGFIDPEVYRIASFFAQNPTVVGDPFLDVTTGSNYVFSAAPGWNPTTGWGGVYAPAFLAADRNTTVRDYHYTGPTPGLPAGYSGGSSIPWVDVFVIFAIGILVAILLVIFVARPSRRDPTPGGVPWGAQYGGMSANQTHRGGYPGATVQCPYCGAPRSSESERCPNCGAR